MIGNNFYMYISSRDSTNYHPSNEASKFTVELSEPINLNGSWEVSLVDLIYFQGFNTSKPIFFIIYSDICEESFMNNTKLPILHRCYVGNETNKFVQESFSNNCYKRIKIHDISRIELNIKSETGNQVSFKQEPLWCTLHFRQCQN